MQNASQAFETEVRAFVEARLPEGVRRKVWLNQKVSKSEHIEWQQILAAKGWFTGHWPVEFGGLGWSAQQRWVFENELYRGCSPWIIPFGVSYVAPVLYTYGTRAQCDRFLPDIRNSSIWWAQGYSEPGAGSDLARVATRAQRDGSDWIVSGRKIWTTYAHWADMIFAIVRTDDAPRPQQGLSFMLIDLHSPGVTVRPIETIDECHHLNEVIFDEVRVPAENLVGEPGRGWSYSKFLLGNERLLGAEVGRCDMMLRRLEQLLSDIRVGERPLVEDPIWRQRTAALRARLMSLESLALSLLQEQQGGQDPGARASTLKLLGSHLAQDIDVASLDAVSVAGLSYQAEALDPAWAGQRVGPVAGPGIVREYLHGRANSIVGGSSEIQKNIIAKAVLGL